MELDALGHSVVARSVADAVMAFLSGSHNCDAICEKLSRLINLHDDAGAALAHIKVASIPRPADPADDVALESWRIARDGAVNALSVLLSSLSQRFAAAQEVSGPVEPVVVGRGDAVETAAVLPTDLFGRPLHASLFTEDLSLVDDLLANVRLQDPRLYVAASERKVILARLQREVKEVKSALEPLPEITCSSAASASKPLVEKAMNRAKWLRVLMEQVLLSICAVRDLCNGFSEDDEDGRACLELLHKAENSSIFALNVGVLLTQKEVTSAAFLATGFDEKAERKLELASSPAVKMVADASKTVAKVDAALSKKALTDKSLGSPGGGKRFSKRKTGGSSTGARFRPKPGFAKQYERRQEGGRSGARQSGKGRGKSKNSDRKEGN